MDIFYTIKSIFESKDRKIHIIFEEPVNIIDNLYYCNMYSYNNYSIIRDYNFKNIINISEDKNTYEEEYKEIIKYHKFNINIDTVQVKEINELVELINQLQLYQDVNIDLQYNVMIYSDSEIKIYLVLVALYIIKYNYSLKKSIRQIEKKFNLKKNYIKFDNNLIDLLEKL